MRNRMAARYGVAGVIALVLLVGVPHGGAEGTAAGAGPDVAQADGTQPAAPPEPAAEPGPLPPPAYASPRDTLRTFYDAMERGLGRPRDPAAWERAFGALDMPPVAGAGRRETALALLGVLNGLGRIDPEAMAPDRAEAERQNLREFEFFPNNPFPAARALIEPAVAELGPPPARIVLAEMADGTWRFSGETLGDINILYSWIEAHGVRYGADIRALSPAAGVRGMMPAALRGRFVFGLEPWQWIGLLLLIFIAVAVDVLSRLILTPIVGRLTGKYIGDPDGVMLRMAVRPLGLVVGALVFLALVHLLGITGMALSLLVIAARVVLTVGLAWAAWTLTDMTSSVVIREATHRPAAFRTMLVPLVRKTAKLFIIALALLYIADAFNIELLPLLGSLGLAGLAISFAAQDLIRNLFGGLTVFMDRPYKVGERINYKGFDGIIEEIDFRITRMRTLTGHVVTIPNGGITNDAVENISRRPSLRRIMNLTITYDTPPEKVQQAVQIVRDILEEPGIAEPIHGTINGDPMPPRVYFNDFNAASLNIFVIYWHIPPEWWPFQEHGERLNLRIFEEFGKAEIEFAFPTQTLYLAGDPNRELAVRMLEGNGGPG